MPSCTFGRRGRDREAPIKKTRPPEEEEIDHVLHVRTQSHRPTAAGRSAHALKIVGFPVGRKARGARPGWQRHDELFEAAARQLGEYFTGARRDFDVPLEPEASAFQATVLEALRRIPYGETRSYGEVARAIGRPNAARAVGAANGRNPLPILIPCHRVIGSDGRLTDSAAACRPSATCSIWSGATWERHAWRRDARHGGRARRMTPLPVFAAPADFANGLRRRFRPPGRLVLRPSCGARRLGAGASIPKLHRGAAARTNVPNPRAAWPGRALPHRPAEGSMSARIVAANRQAAGVDSGPPREYSVPAFESRARR